MDAGFIKRGLIITILTLVMCFWFAGTGLAQTTGDSAGKSVTYTFTGCQSGARQLIAVMTFNDASVYCKASMSWEPYTDHKTAGYSADYSEQIVSGSRTDPKYYTSPGYLRRTAAFADSVTFSPGLNTNTGEYSGSITIVNPISELTGITIFAYTGNYVRQQSSGDISAAVGLALSKSSGESETEETARSTSPAETPASETEGAGVKETEEDKEQENTDETEAGSGESLPETLPASEENETVKETETESGEKTEPEDNTEEETEASKGEETSKEAESGTEKETESGTASRETGKKETESTKASAISSSGGGASSGSGSSGGSGLAAAGETGGGTVKSGSLAGNIITAITKKYEPIEPESNTVKTGSAEGNDRTSCENMNRWLSMSGNIRQVSYAGSTDVSDGVRKTAPGKTVTESIAGEAENRNTGNMPSEKRGAASAVRNAGAFLSEKAGKMLAEISEYAGRLFDRIRSGKRTAGDWVLLISAVSFLTGAALFFRGFVFKKNRRSDLPDIVFIEV